MSDVGELLRQLFRTNADEALVRAVLAELWQVWSREHSPHRSDATRLADLFEHVQDPRLRAWLPDAARACLDAADSVRDAATERARCADDESGY